MPWAIRCQSAQAREHPSKSHMTPGPLPQLLTLPATSFSVRRLPRAPITLLASVQGHQIRPPCARTVEASCRKSPERANMANGHFGGTPHASRPSNAPLRTPHHPHPRRAFGYPQTSPTRGCTEYDYFPHQNPWGSEHFSCEATLQTLRLCAPTLLNLRDHFSGHVSPCSTPSPPATARNSATRLLDGCSQSRCS